MKLEFFLKRIKIFLNIKILMKLELKIGKIRKRSLEKKEDNLIQNFRDLSKV